jgi:hypothetical protein
LFSDVEIILKELGGESLQASANNERSAGLSLNKRQEIVHFEHNESGESRPELCFSLDSA